MPTHGRRGLARLLLGSTTERVVRRSDVPVLTIRPSGGSPPRYPYRRVLVPVDGSPCATEALRTGIKMVDADEGALHLLSVVNVASLGVDVYSRIETDVLEQNAKAILEEASDTARDAGVQSVSKAVEYGSSVPAAIRSYIEEADIDLVVVGTHGRTGFDRYLLGSVAEQLVRTASVPVVTVRRPGSDDGP